MLANLSLDSELRSISMVIHMRGVSLPSFDLFETVTDANTICHFLMRLHHCHIWEFFMP
jgi:hypothetical protein